MNFFYNFETAPMNKVSLTFSSQNHTPLQLLPMLQWLISNCNQTVQADFLAFYNNLVSRVRDLVRPWNFWKYVALTNEVYWWNHSHFWWHIYKSVSGLKVIHQSCYIVNGIIDCHHCTRDTPGTKFHLIQFLEVEILLSLSVCVCVCLCVCVCMCVCVWRGEEWNVYPHTSYYLYPFYAHYSSKKVYAEIK